VLAALEFRGVVLLIEGVPSRPPVAAELTVDPGPRLGGLPRRIARRACPKRTPHSASTGEAFGAGADVDVSAESPLCSRSDLRVRSGESDARSSGKASQFCASKHKIEDGNKQTQASCIIIIPAAPGCRLVCRLDEPLHRHTSAGACT
jgi:hypothetical protein